MKKSTKEFRALSKEELQKRLNELKKELLKLKVGVATGGNVANAGKIKQARKNIARIITILHEKGGITN